MEQEQIKRNLRANLKAYFYTSPMKINDEQLFCWAEEIEEVIDNFFDSLENEEIYIFRGRKK